MEEGTAVDRTGWVLIENDGALFRGPGRGNPFEVWGPNRGWTPYAHAGRPRGVEWGNIITEGNARALMALWLANYREGRTG